jgi:site-specific DNA-cytosine methylase
MYFIYENNKSMSAAIRASITETFGFEPICINSALVSAQNRQRLYWVGKRNTDGTYSKVTVDQPEDRGILLKDVLDEAIAWQEKSFCITATEYKGSNPQQTLTKHRRTMIAEPVRVGSYPNAYNNQLSDSQGVRVYSTEGKSITLCGNGGGGGAKTGLYGVPICHTIPQPVRVRKYTCDLGQLQTLLRESKKASNLTNNQIADKIGRPNTEVDHWFRTDKCFSVPNEDIWFDLKTLLNIHNTDFDDFVTVFEERDGVFDKSDRCYDVNGKMSTLMTGKTDNIIAPSNKPIYEVKDGMITIKGKRYPIKLQDDFYLIRKLTVSECKRLQTVPEWYEFHVSDTQAYKMLGNGWTVDVIAHLINATQNTEQSDLFSMAGGL